MEDFGLTVDVFNLQPREDAGYETETSGSEQCFVSSGSPPFYNMFFWVAFPRTIEFKSPKDVFGRSLGVRVGKSENFSSCLLETGSDAMAIPFVFLDAMRFYEAIVFVGC